MKYFIRLSYNGSKFHGWQRQPKFVSVQAVLEEAVAKMCKKEKINCIGCGRTDSGVHASQYYCHFVIDHEIDFDPVFRLNKMLTSEIAVQDVFKATQRAHAQKSATSRSYTYFIHQLKNPHIDLFSSYYPDEKLDFSKMVQAVSMIKNASDFKAFCKKPAIYKNTFCNIFNAAIWKNEKGDQIAFQITANRFLRGMVRLLVGNLIEVGKGRISLEEFQLALNGEYEFEHFNLALPNGLYLTHVEYPFLETKPSDFFIGSIHSLPK